MSGMTIERRKEIVDRINQMVGHLPEDGEVDIRAYRAGVTIKVSEFRELFVDEREAGGRSLSAATVGPRTKAFLEFLAARRDGQNPDRNEFEAWIKRDVFALVLDECGMEVE